MQKLGMNGSRGTRGYDPHPWNFHKIVGFLAKIVSEYDQEKAQSQTADKPMASWGWATGLDSLTNLKAAKSAFNVRLSSARQPNAI